MPSLSPLSASGASAALGPGPQRPPLMKRQSSASSHGSTARNAVISPGSAGNDHQPLRHHVKPRHTKIVLPRNHSSARNLTKLARQAQQPQQSQNAPAAEDGRKHSRQRSHEGDTEIRLPGSLDESSVRPQTMRRNMTAYQLPRNTSHAKLKKNLSHGQLNRLGSGRNLQGLTSAAQKAPPSPGLKGRSKRPKSAEMTGVEKDLHEQEMNLYRQQQEAQQVVHERKGSGKKVGFAVGSAGDTSDAEDPQMEGSGLQEDEWTEESASASPYSTRQNTANNSRRTSTVIEKVNEKLPVGSASRTRDTTHTIVASQDRPTPKQTFRDQAPSDESDDSQPPSPRSKPQVQQLEPPTKPPTSEPSQLPQKPAQAKEPPANPLHQAKDHAVPKEHVNPATRRLMNRSQQLPAPALVSNISALDDGHSSRESPAASMRSSRSNIGDGSNDPQEDELVSRFVPSASHPSTGSGGNTALNTPKQNSGFHTPEEGSTLAAEKHQEKAISGFAIGPVSPGSTVSGSSGATTPAIGRSRTELKMMQDRALADLESAADKKPYLPAHVYDRRNESLKSYLNMASLNADGRGGASTGLSMGPDVFQGRFRALNTELRVVQKFRNPIGEAVTRLKNCKGSKLNQRASAQRQPPAGLSMSKSAVSLPAQQRSSNLSKSASPPKIASSPLKRGQSTMKMQAPSHPEHQKQRREVSFARAPPETREFEQSEEEMAPDVIARRLWEAV